MLSHYRLVSNWFYQQYRKEIMKKKSMSKFMALLLAGLLAAGTGAPSVLAAEENAVQEGAFMESESYAEPELISEPEMAAEPETNAEPSAEPEEDEPAEELEITEEELQTGEDFSFEAKDSYIVSEMDGGAEPAEGITAGDELLRAGAVAPTFIPDLNSWIPIRNQSPYGNCWAYAVTSLAESYMLRKGREGNTVDYSELALTYSLFHTPLDPLGGTAGDSTTVLSGDYRDVGGNSFWGLQILSQWWGPLAEGAMTISPSGLNPSQPSAELLRSDVLHLENFFMINILKNRSMVKEAIREYGAVTASYWDPRNSVSDSTEYYNKENNAFFYAESEGKTQNHAITLVGWDDTFPAEYFPENPGENGAWLVRNSWGGSGMGYDGYFWMSYKEPSLIKTTDGNGATAYVADFGSASRYANNYQYDGGVSNANISNRTTTLQAANVFTAHSGARTETVEAVSVGVGSANTTAKVEVYTDLADPADPTSGTKAAEASRNLTFTGQYLIPLNKKVQVSKGQMFSVVVTLTNISSAGNEAKIMAENEKNVYEQVQASCAIQKGQSFIFNGVRWEDRAERVSDAGNLRIKAFTNNSAEPTPTPTPAPEVMPSVSYQTHIQTIGWQDWVSDGATSGTTGQSKRLEGIRIQISKNDKVGIQYRTHIQTYGWESGWSANGAMSGTTGQSKRLEAIQIKLTGTDADKYDVYYCVHAQHFGWLGWAKNGESAGTAGYAYRLEGIQIRIVKKGSAAPQPLSGRWVEYYEKGKDPQPPKNNSGALITYNTHVQTYGWQDYVFDGGLAGTTGQSKRLEGIHIQLLNQKYTGDIEYRTHIQTYGWEPAWKKNGAMSGTTGQKKRLEAIQIRLTGKMAEQYDIYYQTHIQHFGWSGWAKNGEQCGSAGYSYRLEGIRIVLVAKGGKAPGSSAGVFYSK